jgi:hypothetical protein
MVNFFKPVFTSPSMIGVYMEAKPPCSQLYSVYGVRGLCKSVRAEESRKGGAG